MNMANPVTCSKCGRDIDPRGIRNHEATCDGTSNKDLASRQGYKRVRRPKTIKESPVITPTAPIESRLLQVVNLKGEYDKMEKILNPDKYPEKKYQCAECQATFDNLKDGCCPDCGIELG